MSQAPRKPVVKKRYYTRLMDLYRYSPVPIGVLNPPIRWVFARKAHRDVRSLESIPDDRVDGWYREHRVFFGFCLPRSGSTFLADMLNESLAEAIVQHEANVVDYYHYHRALQDEQTAGEYVSQYRRREIVVRMSPYRCSAYGEINPFLRRHAAAVREHIPEAVTFHLVRDGRKVLRSLMSRELLGVNDPMGKLTMPPPDDPYRPDWEGMTRFERLCWTWQADNRFIRDATAFSVRFEELTGDYGYFDEHLMGPLGLSIPEEVWRHRTARTTNATPRYTFPSFDEWSDGDRNAFERICGAEMAANGYPV